MGSSARNIRNLLFVVVPLLLLAAGYGVYVTYIAKPDTETFTAPAGDPDIAAANAEARKTLPGFLAHLKAPEADEGEFLVKFRLGRKHIALAAQEAAIEQAAEETEEFIWAANLSLSGDGSTITGVLVGEPRAKGFHTGQTVSVPVEDIFDWAYLKSGVMQGNVTTRVILDRLPARQAAQVRRDMGWD